MPESIQCFLAEATGADLLQLRRYADPSCAQTRVGCHEARFTVGEVPRATEDPEIQDGDPRWPRACPCGYQFSETDHRQVFRQEIYRAEQPGHGPTRFVLDEAHVGALWRATFYEDLPEWRGPDGQTYAVMTPGGVWIIDAPATDRGRWVRTGSPPKFTVRPSILIRDREDRERYHGWLTDGVLVPC